MKGQVLHTVWCNVSGEAAGKIWNWSLLGVKGLKAKSWLWRRNRDWWEIIKYIILSGAQISESDVNERKKRIWHLDMNVGWRSSTAAEYDTFYPRQNLYLWLNFDPNNTTAQLMLALFQTSSAAAFYQVSLWTLCEQPHETGEKEQ